MKSKKSILLVFIICLFFYNTNAQENDFKEHPKREFRAVWIATVANIDWPKSGNDSVEKQKADFISLLNTYKKLNFNTVIVQIRTAGDAFYPTDFAPWSRYLTGKEGRKPSIDWDFLEWMIAEAHFKGFEFHAWLNPYRATMNLNKSILSPNHDLFKHPDWMIKYGDKYYYNPGLPAVQHHLIALIEEVVRNYDIDAIHLDDYFYPYKIKGEFFNDGEAYLAHGGGKSLDDWRRSNVTYFIKHVSDAIKKTKPWVQFGISPFGVWRNKSIDPRGSDTTAGLSNYDDLYADPIDWSDNQWIDYLVPQLYWSIEHPKVSYTKLLKWWAGNTNKNTALYIGNGTYKIRTDSDKSWNNPNEIPNQILETRKLACGNGFFSAKCLLNKNNDVKKLLEENIYQYQALPYIVPRNIKPIEIHPVIHKINCDETHCHVYLNDEPQKIKVRYIVVYATPDDKLINTEDAKQIIERIVPFEKDGKMTFKIPLKYKSEIQKIAITFTDYYGNESKPTVIELPLEKK